MATITDLTAQINSWNYKLYTTADGLPSNVIINAVQDKDGFLWVATASGLCRFDGDEFVTVNHNPNDTTSIPSNSIRFVNTIPDGRLLVATDKGLYIMKQKTTKGVTLHLYTKKGWEATEDNVNQILVDTKNNHVIIFTSAAVHVFDLAMKKITSATYYDDNANASELGDFALIPLLLNNGDVLFFNRITNRLGLFDVKDMKLKSLGDLPLNPFYQLCKRSGTNIMNTDSTGNVWMHYENIDTLFCVSPAGKLISWPLHEKYNFVQTINFPPGKRILWSTTIDERPQVAEFSYTQLMSKPGHYFFSLSKAGFPGISGNLFVDKEQNWWLSCTEGLYYVKHDYGAFQKITLPVPYHNSSYWQNVRDIKKVDSENLLITTALEHCYLYNVKSNFIRSYFDTVPLSRAVYYRMNEIIEMENKRFLIQGDQGFTYYNKKLIQGFSAQNEFEAYYKKYLTTSSYLDKEGIFWNSFESHGITSWDKKIKTIRNYQPDSSLLMPHFTGITEDANNDLWLININQPGLIKLNRDSGVFEVMHNNSNKIATYKALRFIVTGIDGMIYISHSVGIIAYNTITGSIKNITMFEGLPSNIILGLFYYDHHLFISTPNGWTVMNTDDYTMKILKQDGGIQEDVTTKGYYLDSSNETLYVGGKGAVYKVDLKNLLQSHIHATIVINEVKINDHAFTPGATTLSLKPDQNNISFSASSIDFYSGINKKYFYRIIINGRSLQWQSNKNSKKFNFINLSPGNYVIEVKSKNANNEWSINTASVAFIIQSPWYNDWWFYALCLIVAATVIYSLFRYRINQVNKMHRMQQRISSDLHDDIGASLTSINILSQLSQQQIIDAPTRNEYLQKINEQTAEVTDALRDIVWSINPKNDKLDIILARMKRYTAELLEPNNIEYSFETNIVETNEPLDADIRQNLYLIFKEAVNNLAKYSGATEAVIMVNKHAGHIHLQVKDNGLGFDPVHVTKGNGIENMQRRAKAMHAQFKLLSAPGKGTNITVDITL